MADLYGDSVILNRCRYEEIPGTKYIRLTDDFMVYAARIQRVVIVPKGFICDGETFILKSSTEAGIVHDYLYRSDAIVWDLKCLKSFPGPTRKDADGIFKDISTIDKAGRVMSWLKWAAVRTFARSCWHKHAIMDDVSNQ